MTTVNDWAARPAARIARARRAQSAQSARRPAAPQAYSNRRSDTLATGRARRQALSRERRSRNADTYAFGDNDSWRWQWRNPKNGKWVVMPSGVLNRLRDMARDLADFEDFYPEGEGTDAIDRVADAADDFDTAIQRGAHESEVFEAIDYLEDSMVALGDQLESASDRGADVGEMQDYVDGDFFGPEGTLDALRQPGNVTSLLADQEARWLDEQGQRPTAAEEGARRRAEASAPELPSESINETYPTVNGVEIPPAGTDPGFDPNDPELWVSRPSDVADTLDKQGYVHDEDSDEWVDPTAATGTPSNPPPTAGTPRAPGEPGGGDRDYQGSGSLVGQQVQTVDGDVGTVTRHDAVGDSVYLDDGEGGEIGPYLPGEYRPAPTPPNLPPTAGESRETVPEGLPTSAEDAQRRRAAAGERDSGILDKTPAKGDWVRVTDSVTGKPVVGRVTGTRKRGGRQGYIVDDGQYEPTVVFPEDDPNFGVLDRDKMRNDGFGWDPYAGGLSWGRTGPPTAEETDAMTQVEIDELRSQVPSADEMRRRGYPDADETARSWEEWLRELERQSAGEGNDSSAGRDVEEQEAEAVAALTRALGGIRSMGLKWQMLDLMRDVEEGNLSLAEARSQIEQAMAEALEAGTIDDYIMGKVRGALDSLTASATLTASSAPTATRDAAFAPETDPYRATADPSLSLTASATKAPPVAPPAEWFAQPDLDAPTPLTVSDTGRVFGHLATWDTCHIANPAGEGVCVTPPHSATDYAYFHTGAVTTAEGTSLPVGHITMDTMHASPTLAAAAAAGHYDNTGLAVADVRAGEDQFGIWVAGAMRPATTPEQVRTLRSSPLSGDWRRVGGNLELTAALAVNTPGFPIPRPSGLIASAFNPLGTNDENPLQSLTAAGMLAPKKVPNPKSERAFSAEDIAYLKRLLENERKIERTALADRTARVRAEHAARKNREKVAAFAAKRAALTTPTTTTATTTKEK